MRGSQLAEPGTIVALLGPTNTGKTYRAIQRMLGHGSGMIGLPLRLLAREVYDKLVAATGVDQVALVTGEEKRVPLKPRFWVCTVESMPVTRPVAFMAIDEVQLAGDPWRGHVFTDRILNARGAVETWFLGSDTISGLLKELVPTVEIRRQPRLSRLSWAGSRKLTSLPPRSAVVGFNVRRVYEIADRLRAKHGGAAVVMGALSPRARNAQVELYASGTVQHMVATDAIGMGLNLDVHHVALAGLSKFDGRTSRALRDDELAQIAGRAGRHTRDGTFGVTDSIEPPSAETIEALEHHRFPPLRQLFWRNSDLEFGSVDGLRSSLLETAPRRFLRAVHDASDAQTLGRMVVKDSVLDRAQGEQAIRLLWDVARVPDFGKTLPENHAQLLARLYEGLIDGHGELPDAVLEEQVRRLDKRQGDISTLTARIAAVRIWTYVVNHGSWVADPRAWQARVRGVEERLSDALHDQLTARFVDHRAAVINKSLALGEEPVPVLAPGGRVEVLGQPLGVIRGLGFEAQRSGTTSAALDRAVRRLVAPLLAERLEAAVDSPDGAYGVDPSGGLRWDGAVVGQLIPGPAWTQPKLKMRRHDLLTGAQRSALSVRLDRWMVQWLQSLTAPLQSLEAHSNALRAIRHALTSGLGFVRRETIVDVVSSLSREETSALRSAGVRIGRRWVYHRGLIRDVRTRTVLASVWEGSVVDLPDDLGEAPFDRPQLKPRLDLALGFERLAGWWVRIDTLERILSGQEVAEAQVCRRIRDAARPPKRARARRSPRGWS